MNKEDYMKLSKERLAELLAERDMHSPYIAPDNPAIPNDPRPLCGFGGYCTNPFRDCIGCPSVYTQGVTIVTTTDTKT